ncbi:MAG: aminodeoxychorismate/anthranilate synthase component II [Bacteroidetes bacterium]|nr:aminodeoxychorismate/anthranilate synthase component II [Bacteroidota bacterium]
MKILLIDNYDSFTYNLVHYLEGAGAAVTIWRNDEIQFDQLGVFDKFVISPGPGLPREAGQLNQFLKSVAPEKPVLGVCLGFQALVELYDGEIYNQQQVKHGVAERCRLVADSDLFRGIAPEFNVGLYHSWAADPEKFPPVLKITAQSEHDVIMAFEHVTLPVYGVQFHPESILTESGNQLIRNFVSGSLKEN